MSLIVELGTGAASSESYASVADANLYHSNRGNAAWPLLSVAQMEQSLRKATDYMVQAYRGKWKGNPLSLTQALDWPRSGFAEFDSATIPQTIKFACIELALKASADELAPDLERATSQEKVGSLQVDYIPEAAQYTIYRAIDLWLKPFMQAGARIIRA